MLAPAKELQKISHVTIAGKRGSLGGTFKTPNMSARTKVAPANSSEKHRAHRAAPWYIGYRGRDCCQGRIAADALTLRIRGRWQTRPDKIPVAIQRAAALVLSKVYNTDSGGNRDTWKSSGKCA